MRTQYIVKVGNRQDREKLYDYVINKYHLNISFPYIKDRFINNEYPLVIDFKENKLWICDSITCLAAASQNGMIITMQEFLENK